MSDIYEQTAAEMDRESYQIKLRVGNTRYTTRVTPEGNKLQLRFPYAPDLIEEIKNMAGARWNPDGKYWTIENGPRNLFTLQFLAEKNPYAPYEIPLVDFKPRREENYDHQIEMTRHILTRHWCNFACEMGTGKTLACIEAMEASGFRDWFWIAPKSALYSVRLEFEKWKICDICNKKEYDHNGAGHPFFTTKCVQPQFFTYEALRKLIDNWPADKKPPHGVVFDESSRLKNPAAQRSQAALALANNMREEWGRDCYIVAMSGSPAPKSPLDWWHQCEVSCPGFLKEGTIQKFQKRLAIMEMRENQVTGGVYPALLGWRDTANRCEKCGLLKDDIRHDLASGGHSFYPCKDEVTTLYHRMNGLVLVKFKKDCLDLPEKQYQEIVVEPTKDMLRAAAIINAKSASAIQALTLLRELSDGFQYKETESGTETCPICRGSREQQQLFDANHPDDPLDALTIQCGKRVYYDEAGTPNISDEPVSFSVRTIACEACSGTGEIVKMARTVIPVKSPKEDALLNEYEDHEEVGRIVTYAGFTGSIDKCVGVARRAGWEYIRVDGRGWDTSLRGYDPVKMLKAFQTDTKIERLAFIGQPGAAGMGLNLTASPTTVYYSNDFNAESRIQSEDRIHRPGMDKNRGATIKDILCLPSDMMVLNNLRRKKRLQDLSLGQMRDEIAAIKFSQIRTF